MTIAVGMVCTDGLLICADTRQTVEGECVWEDTKMLKGASSQFGDYVAAGCGQTSFIYMAFERIEKALSDPRNAKLDFSEILQREIAKIHKHIKTCSDPRQPLPWVELIVGCHKQPEKPLLVHVDSSGGISPVADKIFMGTGRPIAVAFARIILKERLPLKLARIAAFFFMYQAKESGYGTGGETQACYLPREKGMGGWDDKLIAEQVERMMRLSLLDARNCDLSPEKFNERLKEVIQTMTEVRISACRPKPSFEG